MPPDDQQQPGDIFSAWGQAQDADPNTRRSGMPMSASPAAPQQPPAPVNTPSVATPPPIPQPAPAPAPAPPQGAQPSPSIGNAIASTAASFVGSNAATIAPFLQRTGQSLPTNWCAAFVNGTLAANGVQGVTGPGKNVATSFENWGQPVQGAPQPGDVLVQPRGHPAGGIGGHVGIAAGPVAQGPAGTFYLMQSGNYAGHVAYSWEPSQSVVIRRAPSSQSSPSPPDSSQPQAQY